MNSNLFMSARFVFRHLFATALKAWLRFIGTALASLRDYQLHPAAGTTIDVALSRQLGAFTFFSH